MWLPIHMPPTGDLAHQPGMCPHWESSWRPSGSQAGSQSTEPHQPGLNLYKINKQALERMWRKGNPSALLVGMQTGATTMENSTEFHQKI